MSLISILKRSLHEFNTKQIHYVVSRNLQMAIPTIKKLELPERFLEEIEYPEKRKLKMVDKVPPLLMINKVRKMSKRLIDIRGPELTITFLLHKQFGIRATGGGQMRYENFEMIRNGINKKMDESRCFAIWRVDPPWKPKTKKGQGQRMGGGKGNIDHYVTPVREGRIVVEFGGKIGYKEAYPMLKKVADKLPFKAQVVTQKMLEDEERMQADFVKENLNSFSFEYVLRNKLMACKTWASPYDFKWFGRYR